MSSFRRLHRSNTPEWEAARDQTIGASENPCQSLLDKKLGRFEPFEANRLMRFGHYNEPGIIAGWKAETGMSTRHCGWMLQSIETPCMTASLDGWCLAPTMLYNQSRLKVVTQAEQYMTLKHCEALLAARGIGVFEAKNVGQAKERYWIDRNKPAKWYYRQVQHQMYVSGTQWGLLVAQIGGQRYGAFFIERNEEFIAERVKDCVDFMEQVAAKEEIYVPRT